MKRKAFMQAHFGRIALTFLLLCLIVYTVYHAVGSSSGSLLTSPAREITDTRLLGGDGWLFRDEVLLTYSQRGLVNPLAESGTKVGKNAPLAEVWVDASLANAERRQAELDMLNQTISLLEASLLPKDATAADASGYRTDALNTLQRLREAVTRQNWSALSALEGELLISLNRYGALTQKDGAVEAALAAARSDRDAMLTGTRVTLYNQASSAYYYDRSCVDGYETVFSGAALQSLTPESFDALCKSEPQTSADAFVVGKLCYDYTWSLAIPLEGVLDFLNEENGCSVRFAEGYLTEGSAYSVRFPESHGEEISMVCQRLLMRENGACIAVLSADVSPADFRYLRVQRVEITVGSISGYHIPRQALVSLNGTAGVYIFDESTVCFRRISLLYEGEGYVIADFNDPTPEAPTLYLSPHELIITSGKNLYDGKVYR